MDATTVLILVQQDFQTLFSSKFTSIIGVFSPWTLYSSVHHSDFADHNLIVWKANDNNTELVSGTRRRWWCPLMKGTQKRQSFFCTFWWQSHINNSYMSSIVCGGVFNSLQLAFLLLTTLSRSESPGSSSSAAWKDSSTHKTMFNLKVKYRNDDKAEGKYLISRGTQDCIHIHLASIDSAMQQNTQNPEPHYYPLNLNHTVRNLTKPISKLWRNKWLVQWKGSECIK